MLRTCVALAIACIGIGLVAARPAQAFDLQGHRGARGLAPENTLAAFAKALSIGVTTLETDLAVTKDGAIVIAHDPVLNPDIVRGPDGRWLASPGPAINTLTLAELKRFDIGRLNPASAYARQFPEQTAVDGERIPTLQELFDLVQSLANSTGRRPRFNIETKSSPDKPGESPEPAAFARLVVAAVRGAGLADRTTIQSFDWRTLLAAKQLAPEIETVCLTTPSMFRAAASPWLAGLNLTEHGGSVPRLVNAAACGTWSPRFGEVTAALVAEAQALGLKVVPWTVNARADMARLIAIKVDGLITDYPDRAREVMAAHGIALP
jgi:glycerophosphoryl diester phosphodiesterase